MKKNEPLPDDVKDAILGQQAVAFIGAGFTMPLGLPKWSGLLDLLVADCGDHFKTKDIQDRLAICRKEIKNGNLTLAAWQLQDIYTQDDSTRKLYWDFFGGLFRDTEQKLKTLKSDDLRERMARRKRNLYATRWNGIVTTNFDDFLDKSPNGNMRSCDGDERAITQILSRYGCKACDDGFFYVKLHGGIQHNNMVFTEEDYAMTYLRGSHQRSQKVPAFLEALMQTKQLVFIGCSLESRLLDVRRGLKQIGDLPTAWALVVEGDSDLIRAKMYEELYGIKLLIYPREEDGIEHAAVDRFLELTAALTPKLTRVP